MGTLHHEIRIKAPAHKVWTALADIEAVQHYNPSVSNARCVSPVKEGVGATRHCDLKPKGWVKERVTAWEPERVHAMEVAESEWPIVFMKWRTELKPDASGTLVTQDLEYRMKFGLLGKLMDALMMRRKLDQGINDVFAGLKRYVEGGKQSTEQRAPVQS
jgi:carbon monoxide dehydrogenase subunit G